MVAGPCQWRTGNQKRKKTRNALRSGHAKEGRGKKRERASRETEIQAYQLVSVSELVSRDALSLVRFPASQSRVERKRKHARVTNIRIQQNLASCTDVSSASAAVNRNTGTAASSSGRGRRAEKRQSERSEKTTTKKRERMRIPTHSSVSQHAPSDDSSWVLVENAAATRHFECQRLQTD